MKSMKTALAAMFFLLLGLSECFAKEGIVINPNRIFFKDDKTQTVTVSNSTGETFYFQIATVSWAQDDKGKDIYEKTDEVEVLPLTLTINPQESKQLRIGLKDSARLDKERTYRVFVRQLPIKKPGEKMMQVVVQQGLPVFIPPKEDKESLSMEYAKISEGRVLVGIKNVGTKHFMPSSMDVSGLDKSGNTLFEVSNDPWYVLAGITKEFAFSLPAEGCENLASLSVSVKGAKSGDLIKTLEADKKACVPPPKETVTKPEDAGQKK